MIRRVAAYLLPNYLLSKLVVQADITSKAEMVLNQVIQNTDSRENKFADGDPVNASYYHLKEMGSTWKYDPKTVHPKLVAR